MFTMKEACNQTHLPYETLKFYCNQGLVPNVKRDKNNRRIFDERDIARQLFPDETTERQLELIDLCCEEEHRTLLKTPAPTYPGLEDTLKILSKKYPLYIVSNCEAGYIETFLEATGLKAYFQGHLCPGDTQNAKAANIRQIVQDYHLKEPVYVGDTDGDYRACQKAGVPFVFASYGFGQVDTPDYTIEQLKDLVFLF